MKVLLALCVLATSGAALAADRNIYDVMYLPAAGTVYGITNYNSYSGYVKGNLGEADIKGTIIEQTVGFSAADWLSFYVDLNLANIKQDIDYDPATNAAGFPDSKSTVKGWSDPTVGLRFRAFDSGLRFDLIGEATVSNDDKEEKGDEITNKQGGSSTSYGAEVGMKDGDMQWSLGAFLNNYAKATTSYPDLGFEVKTDAYSEKVVVARLLNKLGNSVFLRTGAFVGVTEEYDDDAGATYESVTEIKVGPELQFLLYEGFLLRTGVTYNTYNSGGVDEHYYWILNVGANYQF
ncbi:MAG TPA: hypothetical protein VNJ08_06250 [Bacteriovoracaceae bacterium]|nr:hypothetical protein [Bacteriovoracaceae bacterium]